MIKMLSNNGYAAGDLATVQQALENALSSSPTKVVAYVRDFLNARGWAPYKYVVIEQSRLEDDYAINGIAAQTVWQYRHFYISILWFPTNIIIS